MPIDTLVEKLVVLRPEDDVAIVKTDLCRGAELEDAAGRLLLRCDVPAGHKVAWRSV